jgi:MFS family permease
VFISPLGDIWGRSITFRLSITIHIFSFALLVLSYNLYLHYVALFIFGMGSPGRVGTGIIWVIEHVPSEK